MARGRSLMSNKTLPADYGARPELAWLPVTKLAVDPSYQRTLDSARSQAVISRVVAQFRWASFQAILATRSGNCYLIIDGQHRVEAAKRLGIMEVPSVVLPPIDQAEQAAAFVRANVDRVTVNPYAMHYAQIAAGEPRALAIAEACRYAGLSIPRYPIQTSALAAGQTLALGTIGKAIDRLGADDAQQMLRAVAAAWRTRPAYLRASLLQALTDIVALMPATKREALYRAITTTLGRANPSSLFAKATMMRLKDEISERKALTMLLGPMLGVTSNSPARGLEAADV